MPKRSDYLLRADAVEVEVPAEGGTMIEQAVDENAEFRALLQNALEEAIQYHDRELDPLQKDATDYYMGRPFGNEEEGRSHVVATEVRDAVQSMMPSLMRVFFGSEHAVEFRPRRPEDALLAEQQTDYVRDVVIQQDNEGFIAIYSAFKDALVRKLGVIKVWWEDMMKVDGESLSGISAEQIGLLMLEDGTEVEIGRQSDQNGTPVFDVEVKRTRNAGKVRFEAVPPEEFVFSPRARSRDQARLVAHVRHIPADELVAMGVDEDLVERLKGVTTGLAESQAEGLAAARRTDEGSIDLLGEDVQDEATRPVRYAEIYMEADRDEDGIAELRLFRAVGPEAVLVLKDGRVDKKAEGELVEGRPFALFCPDPEPHTIVGLSLADYTMDLQKIKSMILRGMLDSLALTLDPVTEAVEGMVNFTDLLGKELGRVVRTTQPGMLREVTHRFVGADALPMLAYLDEIKENRTGISKAAAGLDADALQSSTKAAVAATLSAAQQHIEMVARVFAETGMKQLFREILRLTVQHQDRPRTVRLRNQYVEVNPSQWDPEMDVQINVALGAGMVEERMQLLAMVAQKQEQLLATNSPLVTAVEYRRTLGRILELAGFRNTDEFFRPWGPQEEQQRQQQAQQSPPPPDPTMMLMQIEQSKLQLQAEKDRADIALRAQEIRLRDDRERDKTAREMALREAEIEARYRMEIVDSQMQAAVARDRAIMDADLARQQAASAAQQQAVKQGDEQ